MHKPDPISGDYTAQCHFAILENINLTVPWYLAVSIAYYEYDTSLITDALYDQMSIMMKTFWGDIKHRHKHLIDYDALKAGTAYYLKETDMPTIVQVTTIQMVRAYDAALQSRLRGK